MPGMRLAILTLASSGLLMAQATLTTVRITTDPPGVTVTVDGTEYSQMTSMFWTPGSTHVLAVASDQQNYLGARYAFEGWSDSSGRQYGPASTINVTADPSVWFFLASFKVEYSLQLSFFQCAYSAPWMCGALPGVVNINGTAYWRDTTLWLAAGSEVNVAAQANPGFVFTGWENYFANRQSAAQTYRLSAAWVLQPRFVAAAQVTVATSPPGLRVLVDGAPIVTPRVFDWAAGAGHSLSPVSPQQDAEGRYWWFHSWSDGGEAEHVFTARAIQGEQLVTARYIPATIVTVLTDPLGLKVNIDGSDMWPSPNFIWGVGSTHTLAAPAEQTDRGGRRYAFRGWTDGDPNPTREIAAVESLVLVARYELLGRLTVDSTAAAMAILLDGVQCLTPCTIDRAAGTQLTIWAPATSTVSESTRLDFVGWQDQGTRERVWTFTKEEQRLTAVYRTMYRVQAAADPAGSAQFHFGPPSSDGFYAAGAQVLVTVDPQPGFVFRSWGGDLDGLALSIVLSITQPRNVVALLDRVPYVAVAGVVNAAGVTPEPGVAAGSLIAIYGTHLAPATMIGPASPLAQTLAGVTVQANGRYLPLLFVSPEQINALVFSDFNVGDYRLTVRSSGQPDVSVEFKVVRNAPGLFAVAIRPNGSVILPSDPARPGEVVTLFGTGFGPYFPSPLDGFSVPLEPEFPLVDPVEVLAGDLSIAPRQAMAAAGFTGVATVSFQVPEAPPTPLLPVKLKINGHESNMVALPVLGR